MRRISAKRFLFAVISLLTVQAHAAKVVRLYNPWANYGTAVNGKIHLVNYFPLTNFGPDSTANIFHQATGNWIDLVMPANLPAGNLNFTIVVNPGNVQPYTQSYGSNGIGGGDMNLGALFDLSDTVWIVPSPLPNGRPKLLTTRPREMTLMLWNPWESETGNSTPSYQVEGGAWSPMVRAAKDSGWYSTLTLGFASLNVLFRDLATTRYFGTPGVGPLPVGFSLDSLVDQNDTIWIWTSPEPDGKPRASTTHPRMKTVMLFNPWGKTVPIQRPRIVYGTSSYSMRTDPTYCGWYSHRSIERPYSVLFRNTTTGQNLGVGGFNNTTNIDLSSAFSASDTAWITTQAVTGIPSVRNAYTGELSLCEITMLGATVRDFDPSHPAFEHFTGGVIRGLVQTKLGADQRPLARVGDTTEAIQTIYDWFHDVPAVNATTCRDIPLSLDAKTGNYGYDNSFYFPIDDFTTLANGSPNPRNRTFIADDAKAHNFHFCLESHAIFEYHKGQTFDFSGDDDVWVFINRTLAVDLGGVHGTANASVKLDTMGLIEGNTYPFDFFFCERRTNQSHMKITTSLNLRNQATFKIVDTALNQSKLRFDLYVSQTVGQGCSLRDQLQKTVGQFVLSGPSATPPLSLGAGTSFGGIVVEPTLTGATIDTNSIKGLAPGLYTLRIFAGGDTSKGSTVTFTVPPLPLPEFLVKPPHSSVVGSFFAVSVVSRSRGQIDTLPVVFHLPAIPGISFFQDSLATTPIFPSDTLMTGSGGVPRRVWLRGDLAGSYTIQTSSTGTDIVDTYPDIVFTSRGIRYVDSLGNPIVAGTPIDRDVRTSHRIWIQATTGGGICDVCTDTILLSGSNGLVFSDLPNGAPIRSVRLASGLASVWVTGVVPVSGGFISSLLADSSTGADWTPVTFRPPFLTWRDTLGQILPSLSLEASIPRKVVLTVNPALDTCVRCDRGVALPPIPGFTYSSSSGGTTIDSIVLSGGSAIVWVTGGTVASGILVARSDSLWAGATLPANTDKLRLWIVDSVGNPLDGLSLEVLQSGSVHLMAVQNSGLCTVCDQTILLDANDPFVAFSAVPGGPRIQSIELVGGRARIWVSSPVTIPDGARVEASNAIFQPDSFRLLVSARPPDSAYWSDENGDGSADRLDVHFAHPWRFASSLATWWPDPTHPVDMSTAVLSLSPDSLHGTWTFAVGIAPLTTSGSQSTGILAWDGRTILPFPIGERIAPVPLDAEVRFAFDDAEPDTFRVLLSEPVNGSTLVGSDWFSSGRPSTNQSGTTIPWIGALPDGILSPDGKSVTFLVDATWRLVKGDSLRISPLDRGTVRDTLGNGSSETARWIPIRLGPHPLRLDIEPYPPVRKYEEWSIPLDEPILQIFVRSPGGSWSTLPPGGAGSLGTPAQDTSHYSGIILRLNRAMTGMAYVYDNIGISLGKVDLQPLANAVLSGLVETDRKGNYEALLAWNGMAQFKIAPSGVYLIRVFTHYVEEGRQVWTNQTFRVGWKRLGH